MANRHFAALGDVWKHLPLAEVLRLNPPRHYWETHAGSAIYPLTEGPARDHGALRFLARAAADPVLAESAYLAALRALPGRYPGSATLALRALQAAADYVFCDLDPDSASGLRQAAEPFAARVLEADGATAIARLAASSAVDRPSEVLVHIDPFDPHERHTADGPTPVELAADLARRGFRVFYWYGYDTPEARGWALADLAGRAPGVPIWCGDLMVPSPFVYPGRPGAWGCGIVLANATEAEAGACEALGRALERISADDILPGNQPERSTFAVISA